MIHNLKSSTSRWLMVLVLSLVCWACKGSLFGSSFELRIRNDMGTGRVLKAQCKSNNNETSAQVVQPGMAMSMVLVDKLFNRSKVNCNFKGSFGSGSGSGSGSGKAVFGQFEVFEEGETGYACGEVCEYSVREDGLWMYDFRDAQWEFKGKWIRH